MNVKALKYLTPITLLGLAVFSFFTHGWLVWLPLFYAWIFIPLVELFIPPQKENLTEAEAELAKKNRTYDYLLYFFVLMQYVALAIFLYTFNVNTYTNWEIAGRVAGMGLLCGIFGINVGHELGHRVNLFEQTLAKATLLTSLYMHFFIEHNKGHHKRVATPEDPSSARYNEPLFLFFFRSILFSYLSAWNIANSEIKKKKKSFFQNEMLQFHCIQLGFIFLIYFFLGMNIMLYFLLSAFIGILLLETVNYIEHYGLSRKKTSETSYERAMPHHSWNSNHLIGRLMLFELSRHSDHHFLASKKYQLLQHHDHSPQLPTGYPGSMLLSFIPPLWFYVMNKKIKKMEIEQNTIS